MTNEQLDQAQEQLRRALDSSSHGLDDHTILILKLRFGMVDDRPRTREEVGEMIDRSVEHVRGREIKGLKALGLTDLAKLAPGARGYTTNPDGMPRRNVMQSLITGTLWWRTEDDTWTDGETTSSWPEVETAYGPFGEYQMQNYPASVGELLIHKGLVDRDPVALAYLAYRIEEVYKPLGWQRARRHAIEDLRTIMPGVHPGEAMLNTLSKALAISSKQILTTLGLSLAGTTIFLNGEDFRQLVNGERTWAGGWEDVSTAKDRFHDLDDGDLSDSHRNWRHAYWVGDDWTRVVLARSYLDSLGQDYEIIWDSQENELSYVILANYYSAPECRNCPWEDPKQSRPSGHFYCRNSEDTRTCLAVHGLDMPVNSKTVPTNTNLPEVHHG